MHVQDKDLVEKLSALVEGDQLRAAVYAREHTALSFTHWLGPPGNYLVARPAARAAARKDTERTGLPLDAAVVLGLGTNALHVWAADPMTSQVKDHLGSVSLQEITGMSTETDKSWAPLAITFAGDEQTELEARGDVSGFVRAFDSR